MNLDTLKTALVGAINQVFNGAAQLETARVVADPKTRAIAARALFDQVYAALSEINMTARKIDQYGNVYIDWDEYLNCLDVFYDNGALFAVVTRGGKLYRIPITVTNDVATLGELVEIPLTARTRSRVWVTRGQDGKRRWVSIAGSAVINRSGELDTTLLFDSFIRRANESGKFPLLSFYHQPEIMRFGVADYLARDEYLYLATGTFDETPIAQAVADGLERAAAAGEEWGNSIGFTSFGDPGMLDVGDGVSIPMYVDGENSEISIVLERDAAALFTRMSTQEVNRMKPDLKQKFAQLTNEELANEIAAATDEANRTIAETGMIARDNVTQTPAPVTTTPVVQAPAPVQAPVETPAAPAQERESKPQIFEIPEEMFASLVQAVAESPEVKRTMSEEEMQGMRTQLEELQTVLDEMQNTLSSAMERAVTAENRLALLEKDEKTRQAEWLADLPPQRTVVTLRPREARAVNLDADGQPAAPDSTVIANKTLAGLKSKHVSQHA